MQKLGFKPEWKPLHDKRADQFKETYFGKGKIETVEQQDFMKWAYGKKS